MQFRLTKSVKNLMQLTTANLAVKILGLLMIAFYTRYLTKEDLAIFPAYEMLAALAMIIFGLGLQPTLIRELPALLQSDREKARGMMYTGAAILISGGAVFGVAVFLLADTVSIWIFKSPDFAHLLRIASFGFFLTAARNVAHYYLWAGARFEKISIVQVVTAMGRVALAGGLVLAFGLPGLVWGLVLTDLITFLMSFWYLRDLVFGARVRWHPAGKLVKESLPFYLEGFLIYFRSQGDNWIVAAMLGPSVMAVFYVAKRLPQMLLMFLESLDKVVTSEIARRQADTEEIRLYIRRTFLLNGHLVIPGVLLLIGLVPAFIVVVAGKAYTDAVVPCILLCLAQLITTLNIPLARGIFITRPPLTRVALTVIESVALIISLFIFAPLLGATGVALSRLPAGGAALLAAYFVLRKTLGLGLPWRQIGLALSASLPMAALILGLQTRQDSLFAVPAFAGLGVLLFLGIVTMTNSEAFYQTLNSILPFRMDDPLRWVWRRVHR